MAGWLVKLARVVFWLVGKKVGWLVGRMIGASFWFLTCTCNLLFVWCLSVHTITFLNLLIYENLEKLTKYGIEDDICSYNLEIV